jgi:hypothetical protein
MCGILASSMWYVYTVREKKKQETTVYSNQVDFPLFHSFQPSICLTMEKPDRNPIINGLPRLILLLALVHGGRPNARHNWIFFIPIFILSIYSLFFCAPGNTTSDSAALPSILNFILTASDCILLRNHQPEFRKIGQKKGTSEMTFKERLIWAASLLATPRGIGWAHEPTDQIPPRPTASRGKFIASQFLWIIFYFILWDIALIPIRDNPCFKEGGPSLTAFGWWQRTVVWSSILTAYYSVSGVGAIASIIFVATGLYEPRDCPNLFGSPLDAYTLRKCWGYVLTILFTLYPHHKNIGQSRLAPDASQKLYKPRKFSCENPPSPKRHIRDVLQTFHGILHLWTGPCNWRTCVVPEFL